ncbi:unnamed protein product, partial [Ectocarpus sp. 4 AP-2014]
MGRPSTLVRSGTLADTFVPGSKAVLLLLVAGGVGAPTASLSLSTTRAPRSSCLHRSLGKPSITLESAMQEGEAERFPSNSSSTSPSPDSSEESVSDGTPPIC